MWTPKLFKEKRKPQTATEWRDVWLDRKLKRTKRKYRKTLGRSKAQNRGGKII